MKRLARVLVLLPGADVSGAEAHTAWLARFLAGSGLDLRLAIAAPLRERFAALLGPDLAAGLEASPIAWDTAQSADENQCRQAEAAAELIAAARPDAAVLPLPWPTHGLGLQRALAEAGVPVLAVAHLAPAEPEPEGLAAARALRPGQTGWVSEPVAARLRACFDLPPGAVSVVPNGAHVPPEDPLPARRGAGGEAGAGGAGGPGAAVRLRRQAGAKQGRGPAAGPGGTAARGDGRRRRRARR